MRQLSIFLFLICGIYTTQTLAQPLKYIDGKEYQRAPQSIIDSPTVQDFLKSSSGKVQVLEFFSYGCSWCYKLDPFVSAWSKNLPQYVNFQRIPVEFQPSWHTLAKAYYTARDLNAFDNIHPALFSAIQTEQVTDSSQPVLQKFFVDHGIKAQDFEKTFTSFEVDRQQKWANSMAQAYRVTAVPAIIVQGPSGIYVSTVRMAGGEENLLKVVDFLIQQEHEASTQNKQ
jgi:thiol:disulfide interchange protein DsbA